MHSCRMGYVLQNTDHKDRFTQVLHITMHYKPAAEYRLDHSSRLFPNCKQNSTRYTPHTREVLV